MERTPRSTLVRLMRGVGLSRTLLEGRNRARHSTRVLPTMRTLADPVEYFRKAMSIELEHGAVNRSTDVTHDDLRQTSKIVAAHVFGVEHGERPGNWRFYPSYYDNALNKSPCRISISIRYRHK
jgi:hypothetical protein